jgi:hypothetical protein
VLKNAVPNGAGGYILAGWALTEPLCLADPPKGTLFLIR